jgi:response regulator RpfG family c-di-GMP phosphodiesterase
VLQGENLFNRGNIKIFTAATTDEILRIHIEEIVNLIVLKHDLPGTSSEAIFNIIWQSQHLKEVLAIMVCENDVLHQERCKRCGVQAILATPADPGQLQEKVQQFLNVARRQAYRVLLNVSVDSKFNGRHFLCRMENISATGALMSAELDLSLEDNISCSFYLPDMTKIDAKSAVVRIVKQRGTDATLYGIKYTKIPADSKARIEAYVENNRT